MKMLHPHLESAVSLLKQAEWRDRANSQKWTCTKLHSAPPSTSAPSWSCCSASWTRMLRLQDDSKTPPQLQLIWIKNVASPAFGSYMHRIAAHLLFNKMHLWAVHSLGPQYFARGCPRLPTRSRWPKPTRNFKKYQEILWHVSICLYADICCLFLGSDCRLLSMDASGSFTAMDVTVLHLS